MFIVLGGFGEVSNLVINLVMLLLMLSGGYRLVGSEEL